MKKLLSLLLIICMLLACAASVAAVTAAKTPTDAKRLTFTDSVRNYLNGGHSAALTIVSDDTESGCSIFLQPTAPYSDPYIYFNYSAYVDSLGLSAPTANDVKYVIFKIKQERCSNNMFEIFYCTSGGVPAPTGNYSVTRAFDNSETGWQYIAFDMEGHQGWSGTIKGFRLDWVQNAASANEKMYINEIILAKDVQAVKDYVSGEDLHALSASEQTVADFMLKNAVETAPAVSNEKINAEYEDESLVMWFDHSYYKTPGETVTSNGQNTYQMRLAKNEIECAQMVLASKTAREGLTIEVSDFVNGDAKLTPTLYYGYYFDDVEGQSIVDPIPELRDPIDLKANMSQMFLIKVKTTKDTPAGQYSAILTVKDKDGKEIKKANVYAYVWDFTLPDASNVKTLADLGWFAIYGMDNVNGTMYNDDPGCKCDVTEYHYNSGVTYMNYYNTLLENKINAYGMPYVNEAQYTSGNSFEKQTIIDYLNDPRVQAFNPIGFSKEPTAENITRAYNFLSQKKEWLEKAYFYTVDEPMDKNALNRVRNHANLIKSIWGEEYKLITPMHWNLLLDTSTYKVDSFEYLKDYVNVWCPHTFFFNTYADKQANQFLTYRGFKKVDENIGSLVDRMAAEQEKGNEVWWYVTRFPHYPEITLSISDPAVDHRILFWQQKLYNVDGFLYYAVNDWNLKDGDRITDGHWCWDKKKEVSTDALTPYTVYGNGVLLYHGGKIGRFHEAIESIRLEQIRDGIEDYDYFALLDEKYGKGTSDLLIKQVTTSLGNFKSDVDLFTEIRIATGNLIAGEKLELPQTGTAGDVNKDGKVNNKDVVALFRYVSNKDASKVDVKACDCNGDGKENNKDVVHLFRYVSNNSLPIYYDGKLQ